MRQIIGDPQLRRELVELGNANTVCFSYFLAHERHTLLGIIAYMSAPQA